MKDLFREGKNQYKGISKKTHKWIKGELIKQNKMHNAFILNPKGRLEDIYTNSLSLKSNFQDKNNNFLYENDCAYLLLKNQPSVCGIIKFFDNEWVIRFNDYLDIYLKDLNKEQLLLFPTESYILESYFSYSEFKYLDDERIGMKNY